MNQPSQPNQFVLYPGSFDPVHLGHVDVIQQAAALFGGVLVAVMHNPSKPSGLFSVPERVAMLQSATADIPGVRIEPFSGLAIDAATSSGAAFIVKGLRNAGDFEIEQQMAQTNYSVAGVRTVYVACSPDRVFLSSRFIREIAQYGGDVSHLVPATVASELARRFEAPS